MPQVIRNLHLVFAVLVLLLSTIGRANAQEEKTLRDLSVSDLRQLIWKIQTEREWLPIDLTVRRERDVDGKFHTIADLVMKKNVENYQYRFETYDSADKFRNSARKYRGLGWDTGIERSFVNHLNERKYLVFWYHKPTKTAVTDCWKERKMVMAGEEVKELEFVDKIVTNLMLENEIPGGQFAIAKDGKFVFNRAYGYIDLKRNKPTRTSTLFRIAEASELLTAMAIMHLIDAEKLKMNQPVIDLINAMPVDVSSDHAERLSEITVEHCLFHTTGISESGTRNFWAMESVSGKLKKKLPLDCIDVIRYTLRDALEVEPGTKRPRIRYINYLMLGRVIEKVSGDSYESYVQKNILRPLGIRSAKIGKGPLKMLDRNETQYFSHTETQNNSMMNKTMMPKQYHFNLKAVDAYKGWIMTANDLLRVVETVVSPSDDCPISPESAKKIISCSNFEFDNNDEKFKRGMGVSLQKYSVFKNGTHLEGSASKIWLHPKSRLSFTFIFNTQSGKSGKKTHNLLMDEIRDLLKSNENWPQK